MTTAPHTHLPDSNTSDTQHAEGEFRAPAGTNEFGLWLALIAIAVAFAAGMVAYVTMTHRHHLTVQLPHILWLSTFVILASSPMIHYALLSARANHADNTRRAVTTTAVMALLFLALQIPGLIQLAHAHAALAEQHVFLYALAMFLIVLHAAHVIGGLVPMSVITARLHRRPVSDDDAGSIRLMGMYWHLLAIVWVGMFMMFLLAG